MKSVVKTVSTEVQLSNELFIMDSWCNPQQKKNLLCSLKELAAKHGYANVRFVFDRRAVQNPGFGDQCPETKINVYFLDKYGTGPRFFDLDPSGLLRAYTSEQLFSWEKFQQSPQELPGPDKG